MGEKSFFYKCQLAKQGHTLIILIEIQLQNMYMLKIGKLDR